MLIAIFRSVSEIERLSLPVDIDGVGRAVVNENNDTLSQDFPTAHTEPKDCLCLVAQS